MQLAKKIKRHFPAYCRKRIKDASFAASRLNRKIYLVGGVVRDILLSRENYDLDFVIEGDALEVAGIFSDMAGGTLVKYGRFGTATVILKAGGESVKDPKKAVNKGGLKIDFATAREESYRKPAELPAVRPSDIKTDLFRRDFTINAMAASLNRGDFGRLLDPFCGLRDLRQKKLRALHEESFTDDPTRIFRAVRFEQRFNFKIEPHTEKLLRKAVREGMPGKTSGQRIKNELALIFEEERPEKSLKRMKRLGMLKFIHPGLKFSKSTERDYAAIRRSLKQHRRLTGKPLAQEYVLYLAVLFSGIKRQDIGPVMKRFGLSNFEKGVISLHREKCDDIIKALKSGKRLAPSRIYELLINIPEHNLVLIRACSGSAQVKRRLRAFIKKYRNQPLSISGSDLKAAGFREGPDIGRIISRVRAAKLDGLLKTKSEELKFAISQKKSRK
jgi:tRNA nucleotidyltransferase (CCA-adding enzyme)